MEYLRPVRLVLQGDREKAHAHTRDARRLIARLVARSGGVASIRDVETLPDGTTIEVIVAAGDVTAVITSPGGKRKTRWFEDFVAHPGISGFDNGEMTTYPIIFKHAPGTPNNWVPYFWKSGVPGQAAAPSPKGTYREAFARPRSDATGAHLDGLGFTHVNAEGEAVNYRGLPCNQYIWQAYRQPYNYYDTLVVHLGRLLLNTFEYQTAAQTSLPALLVTGAALRDGWLYTVLGDFTNGVSYAPSPSAPSNYGEVWVSPMYPAYPVTQALVRFKLSTLRNPANGLLYYKVITGSHEVLWQSSLVRALSPWRFNRDVTAAVTYTLPEEPHAVFERGVQQTFFSTAYDRLQLTIDHENASASLASSAATTAIAEDDGNVLHLEHVEGGDWQYRLGEHTMLAREAGRPPDPPPFNVWTTGVVWERSRTIVYADLRAGVIVFVESGYQFVTQSQQAMTRRIILWVNGVEEVLRVDEGTRFAGDSYIHARGLLVLNALAEQAASGMTMYMARFSGHLVYDDGTGPELAAFFSSTCHALLGHQLPLDDQPGTSFGGGKRASHDPSQGSGQPPPLVWASVVGFDSTNNPDPTTPQRPSIYITNTGGCAVEVEDGPPRVCLGIRIVPNAYYTLGDRVEVNYITDGDLEVLSGGILSAPEFAISVTILGKPPSGQTVEY